MVQKHSNRPSWEDIEAIMLVGQHGTVRSAAHAVGVAHTTLAKRVLSAERALGIVAFVRSVKGYTPTQAGRTVIAHAEKMAFEAASISRHVGGTDTELSGVVRVSLLSTVLTHILHPHLSDFAARHPKVVLEFVTLDAFADLDRQKADIAIRFQDAPDEDLFGRRVAEMRAATYASKSFDLPSLDRDDPVPIIGWGDAERVAKSYKALGIENTELRWVARDMPSQVALAKTSTAIAELPCYVGDAESDLVRIDVDHTIRVTDVWVLTHKSLKESERVHAVFSFLAETLHKERAAFLGAHG